MDSSTIHILTFTSQNLLDVNVHDLTIVPDQDILGIWMGECHEDPGLTLVVVGVCALADVILTRLIQLPNLSWISRRIGLSINFWLHSEAATAH
jgi:hypothetical protein